MHYYTKRTKEIRNRTEVSKEAVCRVLDSIIDELHNEGYDYAYKLTKKYNADKTSILFTQNRNLSLITPCVPTMYLYYGVILVGEMLKKEKEKGVTFNDMWEKFDKGYSFADKSNPIDMYFEFIKSACQSLWEPYMEILVKI